MFFQHAPVIAARRHAHMLLNHGLWWFMPPAPARSTLSVTAFIAYGAETLEAGVIYAQTAVTRAMSIRRGSCKVFHQKAARHQPCRRSQTALKRLQVRNSVTVDPPAIFIHV
jgi:hypothetical protein